jgi:hypothetical protein
MKDLERLKGQKPFKTPEGYWDGLTKQIMNQLPERILEEPKKVSLMARVLPWMYLAAVIAGLGMFFDFLNGNNKKDSVNIVYNTPDITTSFLEQEDEVDYLEYLEAQYANYMLAEEIGRFE